MVRLLRTAGILTLLLIALTAAPATAATTQSGGPKATVHVVEDTTTDIKGADVAVVYRYDFFDRITITDHNFFDLLERHNIFRLLDEDTFFEAVNIDELRDQIDERDLRDHMTEDTLFTLVEKDDLDDILDSSQFHRDDDIVDQRDFIRHDLTEHLFEDTITESQFFTVVDDDRFLDDDVLDAEEVMEWVNQSNLSNKDDMNEDNVLDKLSQNTFFQAVPYSELVDVIDDFDEFRQTIRPDRFLDRLSRSAFINAVSEHVFFSVVDFDRFMDEAVDEDDLLAELDEHNFFDVIQTQQAFWKLIERDDFFDDDVLDKNDFFDQVSFTTFFDEVRMDAFFEEIDTNDFFRHKTGENGRETFTLRHAGTYELFARTAGFYMMHKTVKIDHGEHVFRRLELKTGNSNQFWSTRNTGSSGGSDDGADSGSGDSGSSDGSEDSTNTGDNNEENYTIDDLELDQIRVPRIVQKGNTYPASVTIQNRGETDRNDLRLAVDAFGTTEQTGTFSLNSGENMTKAVEITVPQTASGPQTVKAVLQEDGNTRDTISVQTDVSTLRTYFTLQPSTMEIGQNAFVNGRITGGDGNAAAVKAALYLGNTYVTTVQPDEQGYFEAYVEPKRTGSYTVSLESTDLFFSKRLRVVNNVSIDSINAPIQITEGDEARICADIQVAGSATAFIELDGEVIQTQNLADDGTVCGTTYPPHGDHTATVRAEAGEKTVERQRTVTVEKDQQPLRLETDQSYTITQGINDSITVRVINPSLSIKTFTARIADRDNISTATKTYKIQANSSRDASIPIRAATAETFNATVTITEGDESSSRTATITVNEPARHESSGIQDSINWIGDKASSAYSSAKDSVTSISLPTIDMTVLYIIGGLLLLGAAIMRIRSLRSRKNRSLEPRN